MQEPTTLFQPVQLFQQYIVDACSVVDQAKLEWIRRYQEQIRADLCNGLVDAIVRDEVDTSALGSRIVVPSSFLGSDRLMQQLFQDSIAIVHYFGKPTLFITFKANPSWNEIHNELLPMQAATDRPNLIARVFHLKQKDLLAQIRDAQILDALWAVYGLLSTKNARYHTCIYCYSCIQRLDFLHLSTLMKSFVQSYLRLCKTQQVICEP